MCSFPLKLPRPTDLPVGLHISMKFASLSARRKAYIVYYFQYFTIAVITNLPTRRRGPFSSCVSRCPEREQYVLVNNTYETRARVRFIWWVPTRLWSILTGQRIALAVFYTLGWREKEKKIGSIYYYNMYSNTTATYLNRVVCAAYYYYYSVTV